jgi:hypothetical protein
MPDIDRRAYIERTDAIKEQTRAIEKLTLAIERGNHFR